jgi:hypothetical protein
MHKRAAAALAIVFVLVSPYTASGGGGGGGSAGRVEIAVIALDRGATQVDSRHIVCPVIRVTASSGTAPSCTFAVVSVGKARPGSITITASIDHQSSGIELNKFWLTRSGSWRLDTLPRVVGTATKTCWLLPALFGYTVSWSDLTNASMGRSARVVLEVVATG